MNWTGRISAYGANGKVSAVPHVGRKQRIVSMLESISTFQSERNALAVTNIVIAFRHLKQSAVIRIQEVSKAIKLTTSYNEDPLSIMTLL
jgi:hypothetical protein